MLKKYLDKLDGEQREAARAATREGKRKFDDKAASIDS